MEIEKYSPKWLLEKINDSKTDAHKLMHIIEYRKELVESTEQQLILSGVSQQRELLGWMEEQGNFNIHNSLDIDEVIDGFAESKT